MMKKFANYCLVMMMLLFMFAACDDAHNTSEYYFDGIYTVKGEMLFPEQGDTFYVARNIKSMGLETGDRGLMRVGCFVDNVYGASAAVWNVETVYSLLPTRDIEQLSAEDSLLYNTPFVGITTFVNYGASWIWNGIQNVNVLFYSNGEEPAFRMTAPAFVNDTLCMTLLAKVDDGETFNSELLSFDLADAVPLLGNYEKNMLVAKDTLRTKIKMRYYDAAADTVYMAEIFAGKCANPFRK